MFWVTSKMTADPISGGTESEKSKKQPFRAAAEAGVTATPRTILVLAQLSAMLTGCCSPPDTVTPTILLSFHLYSHS